MGDTFGLKNFLSSSSPPLQIPPLSGAEMYEFLIIFMIRKKEQPVHDVLRDFLRANDLETPLLQYRLVQAWPEIVGEPFALHSEALEVDGQHLWVRVSSPAMTTELQMRRSQLVAQLNAYVGASIITDIRFLCRQ